MTGTGSSTSPGKTSGCAHSEETGNEPSIDNIADLHGTTERILKGRLVYIAGKMQTRRWRKDGEESDRFSTEILLVPGGRIQFLDKRNGANGNGSGQPAPQPASGSAWPAGGAPASTGDDFDDDIPF